MWKDFKPRFNDTVAIFFKSLFTKAATGGVLLLYKKRLQDRRFPVNIVKFLNTAILKNNLKAISPSYSIKECLIRTLEMLIQISN